MADNIQIRVDDMRVRVLLERLQARMGNMLPVMDEIGSALLVRVQRTFEREEAPGGGSWQTLAQATIAARHPAWGEGLDGEAARHGAQADAAGLAIARAWVAAI